MRTFQLGIFLMLYLMGKALFAQPCLDPNYAENGMYRALYGPQNPPGVEYEWAVVHMAWQGDRLIFAANYNNAYNSGAVVRVLPNGATDVNFGPVGCDEVEALAVQSDGKIVVAMRHHLSAGAQSKLWLLRLNEDGKNIDPSFHSHYIYFPNSDNDEFVYDMAIQPDGKILVAGGLYDPVTDDDGSIIRFMPDGLLDTGFGSGGRVTFHLQKDEWFSNVKVLSDGKILLAGGANLDEDTFLIHPLLVRLMPDGKRDLSFGGGGIAVQPAAVRAYLMDAGIQSDGRIVMAGPVANGVNSDWRVFRYFPNGQFSDEFGIPWFGNPPFLFDEPLLYHSLLEVQNDRIYCAGDLFTGQATAGFLLSFLPDGALNGDFCQNTHQVLWGATGQRFSTELLAGKGDGSLLVSSVFSKLDANGTNILNSDIIKVIDQNTVSAVEMTPLEGVVRLEPNPAGDESEFVFTLDRPAEIGLRLLGPEGRVARVFFEKRQFPAGENHETLILGEVLPPGFYLVEMEGAGFRKVLKLLKQ